MTPFKDQIIAGENLSNQNFLLTLSDLKTLLSFQFVFSETWQFNSRHLRIKDEILSYPFLFLASSIFFAVSTLKYLTLAFCHSLDCCCCLQRDGGSGGQGEGACPPRFWQTSSPYFNLGTVCSNGFYADISSQRQVQQYKSCLKSIL